MPHLQHKNAAGTKNNTIDNVDGDSIANQNHRHHDQGENVSSALITATNRNDRDISPNGNHNDTISDNEVPSSNPSRRNDVEATNTGTHNAIQWYETEMKKRLDALESVVFLQQEKIRMLDSKSKEQARIFDAKYRVLELQIQQLQNQLQDQQPQSHPQALPPSLKISQGPSKMQLLRYQLCQSTSDSESALPPTNPPSTAKPLAPSESNHNHDNHSPHDHHHDHHHDHNSNTNGSNLVNPTTIPGGTAGDFAGIAAHLPTLLQPPRKKTRVKRSMLTNGAMDLKDFPQRKHLPSELHSRVSGGETKKSKNRRSCAYCSLLYMERKRKDGKNSSVSWDAFVKRTNSECSYCKVVLCRNHFKIFHDLP